MRLIQELLLSALVICALLPVAAFAGTSDCVTVESDVAGTMEADGFHAQIAFTKYSWALGFCGDVAGLDVYRRQLGFVCGPPVLVTDEPLPWTGLPVEEHETVVFGEFVDSDVVPNVCYEYLGRPVDAERSTVPGNMDLVLGFFSEGEAFVGQGILEEGPGCSSDDRHILPCGDQYYCYAAHQIVHAPPEVEQHFNDGVTYRVYGTFSGLGGPYLCNMRFYQLSVTRIEPHPCLTAAEPASWGAVKAIYR